MAELCERDIRAGTFLGKPVAAFRGEKAGSRRKGTRHSLQGQGAAGSFPCYWAACFHTQRWCLSLALIAAFQFVLGNTSVEWENSEHKQPRRSAAATRCPHVSKGTCLQRTRSLARVMGHRGTKKGDDLKGNSSLMCNQAEILYFCPQ